MAYEVKECAEQLFGNKVESIVSPYEADHELAYLTKIGYIDLVLTIDSDLIPLGCHTVFFNLDENGDGYIIQL